MWAIGNFLGNLIGSPVGFFPVIVPGRRAHENGMALHPLIFVERGTLQTHFLHDAYFRLPVQDHSKIKISKPTSGPFSGAAVNCETPVETHLVRFSTARVTLR